jgi:hypothetical protein
MEAMLHMNLLSIPLPLHLTLTKNASMIFQMMKMMVIATLSTDAKDLTQPRNNSHLAPIINVATKTILATRVTPSFNVTKIEDLILTQICLEATIHQCMNMVVIEEAEEVLEEVCVVVVVDQA